MTIIISIISKNSYFESDDNLQQCNYIETYIIMTKYSRSNSNHFMSAKKMPTQKLHNRFQAGKNEIRVDDFQKIVFFQTFN